MLEGPRPCVRHPQQGAGLAEQGMEEVGEAEEQEGWAECGLQALIK